MINDMWQNMGTVIWKIKGDRSSGDEQIIVGAQVDIWEGLYREGGGFT